MKKLLWIMLLVVVAYLAWRWWRGPSEAATADRGQTLVFNRVWVDHLPTSQTDTFDIFAAVTEQPIGVFDHRSQWKGEWELFRYEPRGDGQLELVYPASKGQGARVVSRVEVQRQEGLRLLPRDVGRQGRQEVLQPARLGDRQRRRRRARSRRAPRRGNGQGRRRGAAAGSHRRAPRRPRRGAAARRRGADGARAARRRAAPTPTACWRS